MPDKASETLLSTGDLYEDGARDLAMGYSQSLTVSDFLSSRQISLEAEFPEKMNS